MYHVALLFIANAQRKSTDENRLNPPPIYPNFLHIYPFQWVPTASAFRNFPVKPSDQFHNAMPITAPQFIGTLVIAALLSACSSSETPPETPPQLEVSAPSEPVRIKKTRESTSTNYSAKDIKGPYSTVSPWRYIVTSPEMSIYAKLVETSNYSKKVHNEGLIVLAPENGAFDAQKDWKSLLKEENKAALNCFVELYLLEGPASGKSLEGAHTNIAGAEVHIEDRGGELFLEDGHLAGRQIATDRGIVVPMTTLIGEVEL